MPDDRRGPLVIGVLAAATGGALFLAAGDVLPVPDKTFGAPRWLAAILGLGFFFGGSYIVSRMGALLMTWQALRAPRLIIGAFFWIFALVMDAVAVAARVVTLRVLLRRPLP